MTEFSCVYNIYTGGGKTATKKKRKSIKQKVFAHTKKSLFTQHLRVKNLTLNRRNVCN